MELKLSEAEIKQILLAWSANKIVGAQFNDVTFDSSYSYVRSATLSRSEPEDAQS